MINTQKALKKVGTHNGTFHADEVMATAILKEIYELDIIRTRDPEALNKREIVYDVGGGEFDHHGIDKVYRDDDIPYAACGLIWRAFGKTVISNYDSDLTKNEIEEIHEHVDRILIKGIDALDNGIGLFEDRGKKFSLMHISSMISSFNPVWNSEESEDTAFNNAVTFASTILKNVLKRKFAELKYKDTLKQAYNQREKSEVLILEVDGPWSEALPEIDENEEVIFVIYKRKDSYALQTVRGSDGEDRRKLPESWGGKTDEKLAEVTGVKDAVFCHTGLFIAVAKSYEGIMKMADIALNVE
ncbi:MYG1 family protein [Serpentinicella sp. ANB-PHB4]|uniref:MYG1 family protein n=1 Tax=Serpentinicella sp. ANB-PHB4 TaxID=3074076 RepID=UPI002860113D|nr:MYG1 family protein [Serpentinicella sp. ANB-PHB4]MDR5659452.1 MYG1 family protein [Serpentinicella sp. ANB-PHB4]